MKVNLIYVAIFCAMTVPALAAEKFVCTEYNRTTQKLGQKTVVLSPLIQGEVIEGVPASYRLELFEGANVTAEFEVDGVVNTEDVSFDFSSNDLKVTFGIFLDELNESSLEVNGKDLGSYICR